MKIYKDSFTVLHEAKKATQFKVTINFSEAILHNADKHKNFKFIFLTI